MANLVELFDNIVQMQNLNGVPLANGKMYVYALGRTRLMDTWSDVDGESLNSNPIILDAAGQCHCYVTDDFDYTIVVCDAYDNEIFSIDKYLYSQGSHSHADVAVAPSETIAVSSYHVGETTVYVPYLTGQLGKVYEGIDPIVVNNTEDKISANHVPLGVQDPLYFVQDDEEGCIIGFSGQTIPEGVMSESALGFENNKITGYNGSAFSAGNEYEAGNYVSISNNTISVTGLQPEGDYAYNSALSSKLDVTATGQFLTGLPEDLVYSADITGLATTAQLNEKLDKSDSGNFYPMDSNPSGYINELPSDLATTGWVNSQGYLTAVDIPESAVWNATTQTVSANSAAWAGGTANPQIPVTGINGIKISESGDKVVFEVSADYYPGNNPSGFITGVDLSDYATTAQVAEKQDSLSYGYHDTAISSIDNSAIYDTSAHARINTLAGRISDLSSNKLDSSAFSDVSGTFLTAVDLTPYQTTAGMTAYQSAGDYLTTADSANFYTTANESGFITGVDLTPYQEKADMTAYATVESLTAKQNAGDYLSATDSANFLLTSDAGNFYPMTANPSGYINELPEEEEVEFEEIDLAAYQTVSAMTGYQSAGDYYSASNPSGFITEVPAGTMNESEFEYSGGMITAYNGSAFKAGDEFPQSATDAIGYVTATSANIDSTIDNVSANSGTWGGSALPISAGPGIKFDMVANTLVASIDETVLWSGNVSTTGVTCNLNDSFSSYKTIKVYSRVKNNSYDRSDCIKEITWPGADTDHMYAYIPMDNIASNTHTEEVMYISASQSAFSLLAGWKLVGVTQTTGLTAYDFNINKVVGINRITGV